MSFRLPVPDRDVIDGVIRDLYAHLGRPVTATEIMVESRKRGYEGWYSAYKRRLDRLVCDRRVKVNNDLNAFGYLPGGRDG